MSSPCLNYFRVYTGCSEEKECIREEKIVNQRSARDELININTKRQGDKENEIIEREEDKKKIRK